MYVSNLYSIRKFIVRAQRVHFLNRYITNVKQNFSVCVGILIIIVTIRLSSFNFMQVLISYFETKSFFLLINGRSEKKNKKKKNKKKKKEVKKKEKNKKRKKKKEDEKKKNR